MQQPLSVFIRWRGTNMHFCKTRRISKPKEKVLFFVTWNSQNQRRNLFFSFLLCLHYFSSFVPKMRLVQRMDGRSTWLTEGRSGEDDGRTRFTLHLPRAPTWRGEDGGFISHCEYHFLPSERIWKTRLKGGVHLQPCKKTYKNNISVKLVI